jgi:hypothetical protein
LARPKGFEPPTPRFECQLDLYADRTSTATFRANQLRLWFASMAYVLIDSLRRIALPGSDLAQATCGTIRRKLFKIGALVTISVRRIKLAMASGCPYQTRVTDPLTTRSTRSGSVRCRRAHQNQLPLHAWLARRRMRNGGMRKAG